MLRPCHLPQEVWVTHGFHCWAPKARVTAAVSGGAAPGNAPSPPLLQSPAAVSATKVAAQQVLQICLQQLRTICLRLHSLLVRNGPSCWLSMLSCSTQPALTERAPTAPAGEAYGSMAALKSDT